MTPARRAILSAIAGFAFVLLAIWGVDRAIVQPAFRALEQAQALEDSARARAAIQGELRQLDQKLSDWAAWDDAYAFAANGDPGFVQSNLGNWEVLERGSQLNLCLILDRAGRRLYAGGQDSDLGGELLPAVFAGDQPPIWALLRPILDEGRAAAGPIQTEHGLLLLAVRPILTTQGSGPARGLLAFGRFLDQPLRQALAEQVQVPFTLVAVGDPSMSAEDAAHLEALSPDGRALRLGQGGGGYVHEAIPGLTGPAIALLRTPVRQEISATARRTSRALMGTLGLTALGLLLGQAWWANRVRQGDRGAAWTIATLAVLTGLTLTAGLGWDLRERGLLAPDDISVHLTGGALSVLLAGYLYALVARRERAEARLRTLINAMPDIVCFKDGKGRWLEANAFGLSLFGLDGVAYRGRTDAALAASSPLYGQALLDCASTDEEAWRKGGPRRGDEVVPRSDGTHKVFDVIKVPQFDAQGRRQGLVVVGRDITERQSAEDRLRQSEDKFAKIFLTTPDVVVISRVGDGVLLEVNPGFEAATGYSRAEALGRSTLDLGLWADPTEREGMVADLRQHGEVLDRGFRFRRKDGGLRAGQFSARPLVVAGEACLLFVMRDVTERQRAEADLHQRDRLVQAAADAMALLLVGGEPGESVGAALAVLGAAVDADRAYLFENSTDPVSGAILSSQRNEWCAQTARPQIGNPNLQDIPYEPAVMRWYRTLSAGGAIKGPVRELPASERAMLEPQDILSILVLPIRVEDRFWGFIGFDDCRRARVWTSIEENVLRFAAAALGQTSVRLRAEAALRASEERLREIANKVPGVVFQFYARPNGDMGLYYFSERAAEIFGIGPPLEEALARFTAQVAPEDQDPFLASIRQAVAAALPWDFEGRYIKPDGERLWFRGSASSPVRQGQELVYAGFVVDSSEQKRAEERQRLATAVFEASREAILVTDAQGGIVAVNPAFSALTGCLEAEVLGRNPRLLWAERQPAAFFAAIARAVAHEGVWQGEFLARRKDGGRRAVLASLAAVRDTAGRTTHYVGMATDITEIKAAERRIERLAYYDPLTELPNRALLAQRAELALALAARHGQSLAVLFLDLDRFKEVNDSLGHAEGDALLIQVAARLQALARAEDTICRLGGDEFVLLLSEADQEGAVQVADRALASFREPFELGGRALGATASIGIALYPHDGADFAELLKNADTALYRAKHEGRNTRVFYDREMNAATLARMVLESELRQAIAAGQLRAYYQPKVRLADGTLVGAEALVRWAHPARGLLGPDGFVPVAEASDLIVALGDWMLCEVCRQQAAWRSGGLPLVPVAVNLAARHFRHPGLAHRVQTLLEAHDLAAEALELELTESALLEAGASTAETLAALERLGVRLALDDFGAGYSSLSYLKRLPLDAIKIDRSFVRDLESDPDDRTLTATIVALGQHLGLVVIAEGVETEEQRRILLEQGCDLAQGYLFAPPAPADTFAASWLRPADGLPGKGPP